MKCIFRRSRSSFSLIELLIVVAIIAILAGMLLPALNQAREKGKGIRCVSNVKQLGTVLTQYTIDYDDYLPIVANAANDVLWSGSKKNGNFESDGGYISMYFGNSNGVKKCPGLPEFADGYNTGNGGYGYNIHLGDIWSTGYQKMSRISAPAQKVAFGDSSDFNSSGEPIETYQINGPKDDYVSPNIHFRHVNFASICWLDGHSSSETLTYSMAHYALGSEVAAKAKKLGWFGGTDADEIQKFFTIP